MSNAINSRRMVRANYGISCKYAVVDHRLQWPLARVRLTSDGKAASSHPPSGSAYMSEARRHVRSFRSGRAERWCSARMIAAPAAGLSHRQPAALEATLSNARRRQTSGTSANRSGTDVCPGDHQSYFWDHFWYFVNTDLTKLCLFALMAVAGHDQHD